MTNSQDKENIQKEIIPSNIAEEKHLQSIIDGKHHYYNYECDRIFGTAYNDIKEAIKNGNIKANAHIKILTGTYPHREKGVETTEYSNMFSQERYKFFLNAPFEISNKCCNIMKKNPSHTYMRETGRKPITAQMAITHPKQLDYVMRGGAFDDDGLWKPDNRGLGYWFVIEWINVHGRLKIEIPNREYYLTEYQTEETKKYL